MANKLKNMRLTSVDLVRNGANQEADICLFKSAEPAEDPTQPTTEEKNIFKRFINWLRQNPEEAPQDDVDPIEKADDQPDLVDVYKSAITESLQSIIADDSLTAAEKNDMIAKSLDEYHEAMLDLFDLAKADEEDMSYIFEGLEKSAPEEEDVEKFNPNHDALGRFASGGGGAAAGGLNDKVAGIMAECKEPWEKAAAAGKIGKLADEMQEGDKVTFKHDKRGEMEFVRTKYNDGIMAFNCLSHPNVNASPQHMKGFLEDSVYGGTIPKFTQASSTKKSADIDEIEVVEKFNPNHDAQGRFASGGGGGAGGSDDFLLDDDDGPMPWESNGRAASGDAGETKKPKTTPAKESPKNPLPNVEIDTSSYSWFKHGKEPDGVGYYSYEVTHGKNKLSTYNFHGDYHDGLRKVAEKFKDVTHISVGV